MDEHVYGVKVRGAVHLRCFLSLEIDSKRSGILPSIAIVGRRQTHLRADHCRLFHIARTPVLFDAVEKNKNDVRSCSGTWVEDCGSVHCGSCVWEREKIAYQIQSVQHRHFMQPMFDSQPQDGQIVVATDMYPTGFQM